MCPTCSHTMASIAAKLFMCPRCGTVSDQRHTDAEPVVYVPKLIGYCRQWAQRPHEPNLLMRLFAAIVESSHTQTERMEATPCLPSTPKPDGA